MSAVFSPDRNYRYTLTREFGDLFTPSKQGTVAFCCLNPSTADEKLDDPTVRRCIAFTKAWGFSSYVMLNLFAWRDTSPRQMMRVAEPIGPENDAWILRIAKESALFICAWGNDGEHRGRSVEVVRVLRSAGVILHRLGDLTSTAQPRHPLYLRGDLKPLPF